MNEHVAQEGSTPLMAQFLEIKAAHADYLLFYRMGDFYELFFDDAVKAAEALDIALTKRGKHLGDDIPMCGVPVHAAEHYLEKLIRKGFRVAVCEQVEDPAEAKRRGAKAVVRREVIRLVTPGTLTEDTLLEPRAANLLAAIGMAGEDLAFAAADMSTGEFTVGAVAAADIGAELARLGPREVLAPDRLLADAALATTLKALGGALTPLPSIKFDSGNGERALKTLYRVAALDGFGAFSRAELSAAGALVGYLELTQKGKLPALKPLARIPEQAFMGIDAATRRNLELVETLNGARAGSLLACIDRTVTAGGARELGGRLSSPLTDVPSIRARHDAVAFFVGEGDLRHVLREDLRRAPDIARALARLSVGRGGPRDLAALRDGLKAAQALSARLGVFDDALKPSAGEAREAREKLERGLALTRALGTRLETYLVGEPPFLTRDGGFIASAAHPPLDEVRALRDESRKVIASLETRYRDESGVPQLKIRHNGVLGYFIELTPQHAEKLQAGKTRDLFRHRQTIGSAVRFSTDELATLAGRIADAADKALAIEKELFEALAAEALGVAAASSDIASALAALDVALALAELARERRYARPHIDEGLAFEVARGRHPVVETALAAAHAGHFVPNDCNL